MNKKLIKIAKNSLFLGFFLLLIFTQKSFALNSRHLTIYAEPNTVLALTKVAHIYSQKSNVIISVNFNSSLDIISEIDSGEPADIFISAHQGMISTLRQKGLIDVYNIGYIARDELVLATSRTNPRVLLELKNKNLSLKDSLKAISESKDTLIVDTESNSSGKYSNDFITKHYLFGLKLFNKLNEDRTPVLSIIRSEPEYYALLLSSQVKNKRDFEILATDKSTNIYYQALVIAGDNMETAREFIKFLKTKQAKEIFRQNGFIVD